MDGAIDVKTPSTLDEPISETIMRDRELAECICLLLAIIAPLSSLTPYSLSTYFHLGTTSVRQVSSKLRVVLIPSKKNTTISSRYDHEEVLKQLKDWDLWGPLLVCLLLSIFLSVDAGSQGALVFSAVFLVVWRYVGYDIVL